MAKLQQFATDAEIAPPGVLPRQPQDQLAELRRERWTTGTAPLAEGGPFVADQVAVPAQQGFRADREPPPFATGHSAAQRRQEQAVTRPPLGALHLPAQNPHLLTQREELNGLRPRRRRVDEQEVEQDAEDGVHAREQHRASLPAAIGPCCCPTELSDPTGLDPHELRWVAIFAQLLGARP